MLIDINIFTFKNINLIIFTRINHINNYETTFQLIMTSLIKSFIK